MRFTWHGVQTAAKGSMGIVDEENIAALKELGWTETARDVDAEVVFSFFHQEASPPDTLGRTRVFYLCTTSHNSVVAAYAPFYRKISGTSRNLICVLNRPMQEAFEKQGVSTRIWNHGVNLRHFRPAPRGTGPLTFGYVGSRGASRFKRPVMTLDAFLYAFGPDNGDVRLRAVVNPDVVQPRHRAAANIELLPSVSRSDMPSFCQSLDCLVTFSYAEGYNLPPLEALACGVPCLVTDSPEMHESPYDELCIHVPARRVVRSDILLGEHFAPRDRDAYAALPWVHEVGIDAAVEALRDFARNPRPRRLSPLDHAFSWRGRIESQLLPALAEIAAEDQPGGTAVETERSERPRRPV